MYQRWDHRKAGEKPRGGTRPWGRKGHYLCPSLDYVPKQLLTALQDSSDQEKGLGGSPCFYPVNHKGIWREKEIFDAKILLL